MKAKAINPSKHTFKSLTDLMLAEREAIIFLLAESGMSYRDIAGRIGVSYNYVHVVYKAAKDKIAKLSKAKML